jgi:hypothetical protein
MRNMFDNHFQQENIKSIKMLTMTNINRLKSSTGFWGQASYEEASA